MNTVKYHSTDGFCADVPGYSKRILVRIAHDKMDNGGWNVYVESGHNLSRINKFGVKRLSYDEIGPLFDEEDNVQEFRNLASLFNIVL